MAKETNEILGHGAEADGIEEYDNPLPDWWLALFGITIVWGLIYGISYHATGNSQVAQYEEEMAAAAAMWPVNNDAIAFEMTDEMVAAGQGVFTQNCVVCHGAEMTGGAGGGPNLIDPEWIHGSAPEAVIHTIQNGVLAKGMPAWGAMLSGEDIQAVTAYIVSNRDPNVVDLAPAEPVEPEPVAQVEPQVDNAPSDGTEATTDGVASADTEVLDPSITGESIFAANCVACHMADMTGGVGPNLIDDEWIHGGDIETITRIVTEGVAEKGMIAWGPILGPAKIELVAQYVHAKSTE